MVMRRALLLVIACGVAFGQSFEVASVKPSPHREPMLVGATGGPGTNDPTTYHAENFNLDALVLNAYGVRRYQLSAPEWTNDLRFDVMAKIPRGATRQDFLLMMQDLLRERFKLVTHRETKEMSGYQLVIAKNGPKIKESSEPFPTDPGIDGSSRPALDGDGFPILPPGRWPWWTSWNSRSRRRVANMTMEEFASDLSLQLMAPVTNATGLDAKYDFTLSWVFETSRPDAGGPDLFAAIQEQLGLKLDRKKVSVDMVVVDHIEKVPTEN